MRKKAFIWLLLALLSSGFALFAFFQIRTIEYYTIHTSILWVLRHSTEIAAMVAAACWGMVIWCLLQRSKAGVRTAYPRKANRKQKIKPAPLQPTPYAAKIQSAAPADDSNETYLEGDATYPQDDETLLEGDATYLQNDETQLAGDATHLQDDETHLISQS